MRDQQLYTVPQAARALACGQSTVWRLLSRGELRSLKMGRSRRITAAALDEYVARLQQPQPRQHTASTGR